jgi:hypothetical protein
MRFLVTSCYPDEQQVFSDFVEAASARAAEQIVAGARDYARVADVMDIRELREVITNLEVATDLPESVILPSPEPRRRGWCACRRYARTTK